MRFLKYLSFAAMLGLYSDYTDSNNFHFENNSKIVSSKNVDSKLVNTNGFKEYDKHIYGNNTIEHQFGTEICASREEGLEYLMNRARYSLVEDAWIYIPKNSTWVNILIESTFNRGYIHEELVNRLYKKNDSLEFYHTHLPSSDSYSSIIKKTFPKDFEYAYDPAAPGEYVPSGIDFNTFVNRERNYDTFVKYGVASTDGVLTVVADSLNVDNLLSDVSKLEREYFLIRFADAINTDIEDHIKNAKLEDMVKYAKSYNGFFKLEFEPCIRDFTTSNFYLTNGVDSLNRK